MRALVTLRPAESKKLIARAVANMPEVRQALADGVVIIGTGSTNADVVEACTGAPVDRARFLAGMITRGMTCVTPRDERKPNLVLVGGEARDITPVEALDLPSPHKVLIKGANAVDPSGVAGVLMAAPDGGTIGRLLGTFQAGGWPVVVPVGLEKLIPSVVNAASRMGRTTFDRSLGAKVGLMPLTTRFLMTEKEALTTLAYVSVTQVAAGGIGGSEGSVTLVLEGDDPAVETALDIIESIKAADAQSLDSNPVLSVCTDCQLLCDYAGKSPANLPRFLAG
jgi:hypothetical protein